MGRRRDAYVTQRNLAIVTLRFVTVTLSVTSCHAKRNGYGRGTMLACVGGSGKKYAGVYLCVRVRLQITQGYTI
jgi:hypothetical protein